MSADSFRGKKAHEIELFVKRWSQAMGTLLRFCGILKKTEYKSASTQYGSHLELVVFLTLL